MAAQVSDWGWIHDDELVLGGYKNGTQNKAALKRQVCASVSFPPFFYLYLGRFKSHAQ
jgi:hypothetical protein